MNTCTNCGRNHNYPSWRCQSCYRRARRISQGLPVRDALDVVDRIRARITVDENGCHIFTGVTQRGYGRINLGGRGAGHDYTHRLMYEAAKGPIPDGLHIDHLCRNRSCCNPDHLEAVTQAENNRRAFAFKRTATSGVLRFEGSSRNPWRAEIRVGGRNIHVGLFPTQEAAVAARLEAERRHYGAELPRLSADESRRAEIRVEVEALDAEEAS